MCDMVYIREINIIVTLAIASSSHCSYAAWQLQQPDRRCNVYKCRLRAFCPL